MPTRSACIDEPGQLGRSVRRGHQWVFNENLIISASLIKGDTAFKPPDLEFRLVPVINFNRAVVEEERVLRADPRQGTTRNDRHIAFQEALRGLPHPQCSDRYDFDSIRWASSPSVPISGASCSRIAARRAAVRRPGQQHLQYNLAWFRRLEKDTNSGLNFMSSASCAGTTSSCRNLFWQDFPVLGFKAVLGDLQPEPRRQRLLLQRQHLHRGGRPRSAAREPQLRYQGISVSAATGISGGST